MMFVHLMDITGMLANIMGGRQPRPICTRS